MEEEHTSFGQHAAETVASVVGSWRFVILQTCLLTIWVYLNSARLLVWDLYPFILMNLLLSLQAAYTAPMILMSQNRQNEKDRRILREDYEVDHETCERLKRVEEKLDRFIERS